MDRYVAFHSSVATVWIRSPRITLRTVTSSSPNSCVSARQRLRGNGAKHRPVNDHRWMVFARLSSWSHGCPQARTGWSIVKIPKDEAGHHFVENSVHAAPLRRETYGNDKEGFRRGCAVSWLQFGRFTRCQKAVLKLTASVES